MILLRLVDLDPHPLPPPFNAHVVAATIGHVSTIISKQRIGIKWKREDILISLNNRRLGLSRRLIRVPEDDVVFLYKSQH
jgi:hypothetical protein